MLVTQIIAQTSQPAGQLEVTIPMAITIGGILAVVYTAIQIGDRLWGKKKVVTCPPPVDHIKELLELTEAIRSLRDLQDRHNDKVDEALDRLSNAMTRYIELQQATLKIEEYRHDAALKQHLLTQEEIRQVNSRIDNILRPKR